MFHLGYNLYHHCKNRNNEELNFAIIGLPNGGKSTIKKVLDGELEPMTVPTIGATKPITIVDGKFIVTIFDLGGNTQKLWLRYYHKVHGIIWVVDAAEPRALAASRAALADALQDERLVGKPILVFANKQDLAAALSEVDVATGLGLEGLAQSSHSVVKCTALPEKNGGKIDGALKRGMKWLQNKAVQNNEIKQRVVRDVAAFEAKKAIEAKETELRVAEAKERRRIAKEEKAAREAAGGGGEGSDDAGGGAKKREWSKEAKPKKKAAAGPKCSVVHTAQIWHFQTETSDEKDLSLCRKFNEDFAGSVGYRCTEAATCKCSKYKWKPVCEGCDEWVRAGFPPLTENGPDIPKEEEEEEEEAVAEETVIAVSDESAASTKVKEANENGADAEAPSSSEEAAVIDVQSENAAPPTVDTSLQKENVSTAENPAFSSNTPISAEILKEKSRTGKQLPPLPAMPHPDQ